MKKISIINYGMGNIGSLENMIKKAGGISEIVETPESLSAAEKLILPGVGHFKNAMEILNSNGFKKILDDRVIQDKIPILCICLGSQLITEHSEEGDCEGLCWIKGRVNKFIFNSSEKKIRVPHMGWNTVKVFKKSRLFDNMYPEPAFYFVHSYYIQAEETDDILTTTFYGHEFVSAIERDNIFATQFHPEKSHKYGMKLIENFIGL